jgi:hypothetical protein
VVVYATVTVLAIVVVGWWGLAIAALIATIAGGSGRWLLHWLERASRRAVLATEARLTSSGWVPSSLSLRAEDVGVPVDAWRKGARVIVDQWTASQLARDWREAREYVEAHGGRIKRVPKVRYRWLRRGTLHVDLWRIEEARARHYETTAARTGDERACGIPRGFLELPKCMRVALGEPRFYARFGETRAAANGESSSASADDGGEDTPRDSGLGRR